MPVTSAAPVTDPHAALAGRRKLTTGQEVKLQLARDYPAGALAWVDDLTWSPAPVQVPLAQIDRTSGDTNWALAAKDKKKIAEFIARIRSGTRKPVVLVRTPGARLMRAVDGHTRILACTALGQPVTAWVGTAKTASGPWDQVHSRQTKLPINCTNNVLCPGLPVPGPLPGPLQWPLPPVEGARRRPGRYSVAEETPGTHRDMQPRGLRADVRSQRAVHAALHGSPRRAAQAGPLHDHRLRPASR